MSFNFDARHRIAKLLGERQTFSFGLCSRNHEVDIGRVALACDALNAQKFDQPFLTESPAHRGSPLATELRHQPVVTTTGTDSALRSQFTGDPLKHGVTVIVEPAHQTWIDDIANAHRFQMTAQASEVLTRFGIEVFRQQWRASDDVLKLRILAVQNSQWIAFEPTQAVGVELALVRGEVVDQLLSMCAARRR